MNRIKELISLNCITSKELSEKTGIPYDSLKNYEYGRREPTGSALVALEEYFGVPGAYILGRGDPCGKLNNCCYCRKNEAEYRYGQNNNETKMENDCLNVLLNEIIRETKKTTDEENKLILDILTELKRLVKLDSESKKLVLKFILESIQNSAVILSEYEEKI
ncbi:MAG: helix-turn-helix transcriptional regulator [Anaerovoracaceae bacterium]